MKDLVNEIGSLTFEQMAEIQKGRLVNPKQVRDIIARVKDAVLEIQEKVPGGGGHDDVTAIIIDQLQGADYTREFVIKVYANILILINMASSLKGEEEYRLRQLGYGMVIGFVEADSKDLLALPKNERDGLEKNKATAIYNEANPLYFRFTIRTIIDKINSLTIDDIRNAYLHPGDNIVTRIWRQLDECKRVLNTDVGFESNLYGSHFWKKLDYLGICAKLKLLSDGLKNEEGNHFKRLMDAIGAKRLKVQAGIPEAERQGQLKQSKEEFDKNVTWLASESKKHMYNATKSSVINKRAVAGAFVGATLLVVGFVVASILSGGVAAAIAGGLGLAALMTPAVTMPAALLIGTVASATVGAVVGAGLGAVTALRGFRRGPAGVAEGNNANNDNDSERVKSPSTDASVRSTLANTNIKQSSAPAPGASTSVQHTPVPDGDGSIKSTTNNDPDADVNDKTESRLKK